MTTFKFHLAIIACIFTGTASCSIDSLETTEPEAEHVAKNTQALAALGHSLHLWRPSSAGPMKLFAHPLEYANSNFELVSSSAYNALNGNIALTSTGVTGVSSPDGYGWMAFYVGENGQMVLHNGDNQGLSLGTPAGWTLYGKPGATFDKIIPTKVTVFSLARFGDTHAIFMKSKDFTTQSWSTWNLLAYVTPATSYVETGLSAASYMPNVMHVLYVAGGALKEYYTTDNGSTWQVTDWPLQQAIAAKYVSAASRGDGTLSVAYTAYTGQGPTFTYSARVSQWRYANMSLTETSLGTPCASGATTEVFAALYTYYNLTVAVGCVSGQPVKYYSRELSYYGSLWPWDFNGGPTTNSGLWSNSRGMGTVVFHPPL